MTDFVLYTIVSARSSSFQRCITHKHRRWRIHKKCIYNITFWRTLVNYPKASRYSSRLSTTCPSPLWVRVPYMAKKLSWNSRNKAINLAREGRWFYPASHWVIKMHEANINSMFLNDLKFVYATINTNKINHLSTVNSQSLISPSFQWKVNQNRFLN